MKNSKKRGFTIVELVIVIAVIAILASILIPTFTSIIQKAREHIKLWSILCGSILCMAKRDERKLKWLVKRILSEREEFGEGKAKDIKEKSGVDQRQTKDSIKLQKTGRFI